MVLRLSTLSNFTLNNYVYYPGRGVEERLGTCHCHRIFAQFSADLLLSERVVDPLRHISSLYQGTTVFQIRQ